MWSKLTVSKILLFLFVFFLFYPVLLFDVTVFKIAGAVLAAASLLSISVGRRSIRGATAFFLGILVLGVAGLIGSMSFGEVEIFHLQKMLLNLVLFVAISQAVTDELDLRLLLTGIGIGGFASVLSGLAEVPGAGQADRIAGVVENPNGYGQVCVQSAICLTGLAILTKRRLLKALGFALSLACMVGLFYSASRGAVLSLVITGVVLLALRSGRRWAIPGAIVVGLLAMQVAPSIFFERLDKTFERKPGGYLSSAEVRLELAKNGWQIFKDYPIAGVGFGNARHAMRSLDSELTGVTHNVFTQVLAETGLLGAAAFLFLLIATGARIHRLIERSALETVELRLALISLALLIAVAAAQSSSGNYMHAVWYLLFGVGNNLRRTASLPVPPVSRGALVKPILD